MKIKYFSISLLLVLITFGCHADVNLVRCEINVKQGDTNIPCETGYFDFGNIPLNFAQSITFTIENLGSDNLKLTGSSAIKITGTNANDFIGSTNLTLTEIPSQSSTTFSINFFPKSVGVKTAEVVINNNDKDESIYTFVITGTCTQPAPEIHVRQDSTDIMNNTGSFDFGKVNVNLSSENIVFTIENNGNEKLTINNISVTGTNASMFEIDDSKTLNMVLAKNSTTFKITFKPTSPGIKIAKVSILNNDSDENPYVFNLKGTGAAAPEISVKQGTTVVTNGSWKYDFEEIIKDEASSEIEFTIENIGTAALQLTGISKYIEIEGSNPTMFTIVQTGVTDMINPGNSVTFKVSFTPTSIGKKTATVSIANNDGNNDPFTFTVEGTCIDPEINIAQGANNIPNSTGSYDFGSVYYGSSSSQVIFKIENLGTGNLELTGTPIVEVSGTDSAMFTVNDSATLTTIGNGSSTTFSVVFTPTSAGNKTATISIANNDHDENPYTFTLLGECLLRQPEISIREHQVNIPCTTGSFDFGNAASGFSSFNANFVIENKGIDTLYLTGSPKVDIYGADPTMFYIIQGSTKSSISPGSSTYFTVIFRPTSIGYKSATLSIANNDADENPFTFKVFGVGIQPYPEINVKQDITNIPHLGSFCIGHINIVSTYVDVTFTIDNVRGTDDLKLTGTPKIALSGTDAAMFSVNETMTSSTIAHGSSTTFVLRFTPTSIGTKSVRFTIANNDADENPYIIDITAISSIFGRGDAVGWIGGGSNGWKTTSGTYDGYDYQRFNNPNGICVDSSGNIYVAEQYNHRISKWDSNGIAKGWIGGGSNGWKTTTAPSSGGSDYRSFDEPYNVCVDTAGYIYVADQHNHRICKWDSNGNAIGWIGGGSNGWKTSAAPSYSSNDYQSFGSVSSVFVDGSGNIFAGDSYYHQVCKWTSSGNAVGWIGGGSNGWKTTDGDRYDDDYDYQSFHRPTDVFVDSAGFIYVADSTNRRVCKWSGNGTAIGWIGCGTDGWQTRNDYPSSGPGIRYFDIPCGVFIDSSGFIYVADTGNNRIALWDKDGNAMGWIGGGKIGWQTTNGATAANDFRSFYYPRTVAVDSAGNIYVVDNENARVCKWRN